MKMVFLRSKRKGRIVQALNKSIPRHGLLQLCGEIKLLCSVKASHFYCVQSDCNSQFKFVILAQKSISGMSES